MGKEGSRAYYEDKIVEVKPFLQKNTIETTGAGDTFCGCVLHYICEHGLDNLTEADLTIDADVCKCSSSKNHNAKRCASRNARPCRD